MSDTAAALGALHGEAEVSVVAGVESRGFILGTAVALNLGMGFVEIRKDKRRALELRKQFFGQLLRPITTSGTSFS